jgi:predicted transcriptional regulator
MAKDARVLLTLRLDPETEQVIDALASRFGLSRSAVLRQAVRRWAHAEGIPVPERPPRGKGAAA